MFDNFIIAVEAVLPIFLLILLGMGARHMNLMTDQELNHANRAVFQVMFPIMMFYNIYSADFSEVIWPRYFAFCITMTLIVYFLGVGVTLLIEKENRSRGALIQAIYRGNILLMGLPIMKNLMGEEAVGLTTIMVAITVPLYNVLAVVTLETFRGGRFEISDLVKKIVTNPLILGAVTGLLAVAAGIRLPVILEKPISQVSAAATPISLMILGASFHFRSVLDNGKNLVIGILGKLVVSPAIALTAGYLAGFRGLPLAILIIMFGAPCAVSGYTMAQQMDSNGELAAGCLIFTSLLSCVTICGNFYSLYHYKALCATLASPLFDLLFHSCYNFNILMKGVVFMPRRNDNVNKGQNRKRKRPKFNRIKALSRELRMEKQAKSQLEPQGTTVKS